MLNAERAVLIINQTIREAKEIYEYLDLCLDMEDFRLSQ